MALVRPCLEGKPCLVTWAQALPRNPNLEWQPELRLVITSFLVVEAGLATGALSSL